MGIEAGSIGPGNTNLTILVAHGTFLNIVASAKEDANSKYKGVRVLALTSTLAKLQVEKGTLHTISINNILYTQEMDDLMKTDGVVSWSTLTTFLDKFTSMVTDPTVVSKSQFTVAPVKIGEDVRPTILPSASIGAICSLLSYAAVLIFFLCIKISNSRNSEQNNLMRKELRKFKVGDDIKFIMQLVAEERLRTGRSLRPSAAGAGVELLRDMYGDIRMGLVVDEELDSERPENASRNEELEIYRRNVELEMCRRPENASRNAALEIYRRPEYASRNQALEIYRRPETASRNEPEIFPIEQIIFHGL